MRLLSRVAVADSADAGQGQRGDTSRAVGRQAGWNLIRCPSAVKPRRRDGDTRTHWYLFSRRRKHEGDGHGQAVSLSDAVALLVWHRTCDSQVAGSSPARTPPRSGLGQATYAAMCLCHQAV